MKRQVLFLAVVLLGITSATAKTTAGDAVLNGEDFNNAHYRYAQPIVFVERGVEFLIFSDGSFDFNTDVFSTEPGGDHHYYRRPNTRTLRSTNRTHGAPGHTYHKRDRDVIITHDRLGRVRRVGNVFVNYDRNGRIKRIGSVYMSYRRGQLKQVGGLKIQYNRRGRVIGTRGFVNSRNRGFALDYSDNDNWHDDWNDDWNDDDDYYYYRKNGKVKKQKKNKS
ncbi:hypothetical protein [Winogradskyella sp. PG-2]|uniref:hypothetical protein n=1 Tax=Winogradskyella sp. PG-2 TaxID=754409 RepID=UPI0004586D94|nr:hypothetical protein [Winogradskyella sp. PG-2]BAO77213.1 hypothetical protein WPG_2983 [Winogradskyella sp. PG-2]